MVPENVGGKDGEATKTSYSSPVAPILNFFLKLKILLKGVEHM
jgi:hypothetical protein